MHLKDGRGKSVLLAFLAAVLYALSAPCSKLLLHYAAPRMTAGLLYLGAGAGMGLLGLLRRAAHRRTKERPLTRKELPFVLMMIALDILAPILLMLGLARSTAANVSLLNNFEIVATSLVALLVFHEAISRRLWLAIALVTVASALLSFSGAGSLSFSGGSLLVLAACVCWGFENNCTRMLSQKDPLEIVVIKGFGSGAGAIVVALCAGERFPALPYALPILLLGFVSYGLSIFCYVYAQRGLGAARTSAYYAAAPFVGALLSLLILHEMPGATFFAALLLMAAGAWLAST